MLLWPFSQEIKECRIQMLGTWFSTLLLVYFANLAIYIESITLGNYCELHSNLEEEIKFISVKMSKFVGLLVLLLVSVAVADQFDHGPRYPEPEHEKNGACGKFSTLRMLTHKLRHCEKAARDVRAPVSSQCCKDLAKVSIPCLYDVFSSDAFKKVGVDPKIAITIPHRCHFAKP